MQIREHKPDDIRAISLLYFNTIHKINIRDYTQEQIRAWAPTIEPASFWQQRFYDRHVIVAEDNDELLSFAEFEDNGHIDCFYVHHLYQGRGIGKAMMQEIENKLTDKTISRLFAEVSLTAVSFFARCGFVIKEERIAEYNNTEFRLNLMEKYL